MFALSSGRLGQVQILAAIVFLFLIPTTVIIAQNATNSSFENLSIEGNVIQLPQSTTDVADSNASDVTNQSQAEQPPENQTSETDSSVVDEEFPSFPPSNETLNETLPGTSQTLNDTSNGTVLNRTLNETVPANGTGLNETNQTLPDDNYTLPSDETPEDEVTGHADISVDTGCMDVLIRGETFAIYAILSNSGTSTAFNVSPEWLMPLGFEILDTDNPCGTIQSGEHCTITASVYVPESAGLGPDEIRILVSYVE